MLALITCTAAVNVGDFSLVLVLFEFMYAGITALVILSVLLLLPHGTLTAGLATSFELSLGFGKFPTGPTRVTSNMQRFRTAQTGMISF